MGRLGRGPPSPKSSKNVIIVHTSSTKTGQLQRLVSVYGTCTCCVLGLNKTRYFVFFCHTLLIVHRFSIFHCSISEQILYASRLRFPLPLKCVIIVGPTM